MLKYPRFHTNSAVPFLVLSALEIAGTIGLYKLLGKDASFSLMRLVLCTVLCLVLMAVTLGLLSGCNPLLGNDSQPSPVDVTPIAELTAAQLENLEDAVEGFRDLDYITRFDVEDKTGTHRSLNKIYDIFWSQDEPRSLLMISVSSYREEQGAKDRFCSLANFHSEQDYESIHVVNNNSTEALLCDSRMIRTSDTFYAPNSQRYIRSILRIGSVVITLSEDQKYNNLDKNISTKFIKQLCEMTKDKDQ